MRAVWLLALLLIPSPVLAESPILAKIRQRMSKFSRLYKGIRSQRTVVTREYKPDTNQLVRTKRIQQDFYRYLDSPPQIRVTGCVVDGKQAELQKCVSKHKRKPLVQIFDREGPKHYRIRITGTTRLRGVDYHVLEIKPLRRTDQHFVGEMLFSVDGLRLYLMVGTLAAYPFGLKKLYLKLYFKPLGEHVVVSHGYMDVWVKVPVFVNMRAVSRFSASRHRLLPR